MGSCAVSAVPKLKVISLKKSFEMGLSENAVLKFTSIVFLLCTLIAFFMSVVRIDTSDPEQYYFTFGGSQTLFESHGNHWMIAWGTHFPIIFLWLCVCYASFSTRANSFGIGNNMVFGYSGKRMLLAIAALSFIALLALPLASDATWGTFGERTFLSWNWDVQLCNLVLCILCGLDIIRTTKAYGQIPMYGGGAFGNPYQYQAMGQGFGGFDDNMLNQPIQQPQQPANYGNGYGAQPQWGPIQPI